MVVPGVSLRAMCTPRANERERERERERDSEREREWVYSMGLFHAWVYSMVLFHGSIPIRYNVLRVWYITCTVWRQHFSCQEHVQPRERPVRHRAPDGARHRAPDGARHRAPDDARHDQARTPPRAETSSAQVQQAYPDRPRRFRCQAAKRLATLY